MVASIRAFFIVALASWAAIWLPSLALACRTSDQMRTFLFEAPQWVPPGMISARVQIVAITGLQQPEIAARIINMLNGPTGVRTIRMKLRNVSDSDILRLVGATGIVVGKVMSVSNGELVIEPFEEGPRLQTVSQWRAPPAAPKCIDVYIQRLAELPLHRHSRRNWDKGEDAEDPGCQSCGRHPSI